MTCMGDPVVTVEEHLAQVPQLGDFLCAKINQAARIR